MRARTWGCLRLSTNRYGFIAQRRERLDTIALYPEARACKRPTTEQILGLFSHAERHTLTRNGNLAQIFDPELTPLQRQVLALLGVAEHAFRS